MAKIYAKNTWVDEILTDVERYDIKEDAGTAYKSNMQIVQVRPVVQAGSDVTADRMNNLETGVDALDTLLADRLLTAYTTAGTSTAYTFTTLAQTDLATGERWRVIFNATAGATPTLNRDGKGAKSLKYYNAKGVKTDCDASTIISGMRSDVVYDGTDYIVIDILPLLPRVGSTASSATPAINTDLYDLFIITALAVNITSMTTSLTGSPVHGQVLDLRIVGTASRSIAWGTGFENGAAGLPTTTDGTTPLNVTLVYSGTTSKWQCKWHSATGKIVQVVQYETSAVATGTTILPLDDTIPQNTEGDEYMTLAITPTNANNILLITVSAHLSNGAGGTFAAALFQDSTANALAVGSTLIAASSLLLITFSHKMTAGTTSATTFKIRGGCSSAGTTTFNGVSGNRRYGGVLASTITITEIRS